MKISEEVMFLENAFDALNERYFESTLPKIAITIQSTPRAHGHFTPWDSWSDDGNPIKEINMGAESLKRPVVEIIGTLLHEMVHYYCCINNIKDTSRNGSYHNKRFKEECEKRDLIISRAPGIGFSVTLPSNKLVDYVCSQGWNEKIKLFRTFDFVEMGVESNGESADNTGNDENAQKKEKKSKSSTRKYICPCCGLSIRATKTVRVACMECNEQLEEVHKDS